MLLGGPDLPRRAGPRRSVFRLAAVRDDPRQNYRSRPILAMPVVAAVCTSLGSLA